MSAIFMALLTVPVDDATPPRMLRGSVKLVRECRKPRTDQEMLVEGDGLAAAGGVGSGAMQCGAREEGGAGEVGEEGKKEK
jgi:hypothetical protein